MKRFIIITLLASTPLLTVAQDYYSYRLGNQRFTYGSDGYSRHDNQVGNFDFYNDSDGNSGYHYRLGDFNFQHNYNSRGYDSPYGLRHYDYDDDEDQ